VAGGKRAKKTQIVKTSERDSDDSSKSTLKSLNKSAIKRSKTEDCAGPSKQLSPTIDLVVIAQFINRLLGMISTHNSQPMLEHAIHEQALSAFGLSAENLQTNNSPSQPTSS